MSTAVLERPKGAKKRTNPQESLKQEIRFWLKRVDNDDFLKAVCALVRNEGMVKRVAHYVSLHSELRRAIEEGDRDIAEGRVYSSEGVFDEIEEWLEKS
jgi:hypothetical protein